MLLFYFSAENKPVKKKKTEKDKEEATEKNIKKKLKSTPKKKKGIRFFNSQLGQINILLNMKISGSVGLQQCWSLTSILSHTQAYFHLILHEIF